MIWLLLAPFFYSALSVSARLAGDHFSVWQVGLGRFGLGLILMPVIVKSLQLNLWGRRRRLLLLRGLCGATAFLMLVAAFRHIPLSMAMVLFYLYPAFTALLSRWVTGERTSREAWPFVGAAFAGTTLILWPGQASAGLNPGHLLATLAAVLCAITLLLVRRLGRDNNIYSLYFYLCLVGTVTCLGPLLLHGRASLPSEGVAWAKLAAVALFSIGAQLSINQALTRIPASKVTVTMTAEVPLVAAFGVICLSEPLGWRLLIGSLLVFASGVGLNLRSSGTFARRP